MNEQQKNELNDLLGPAMCEVCSKILCSNEWWFNGPMLCLKHQPKESQ